MKNVEARNSRIQGVGLFALRDFDVGEIILEYDDSDVVRDLSSLTEHDWEFNTDFLENGKVVWQKEPERSKNHSCDPNSYDKTIDGVRKLVAMRHIKSGEEITGDYVMNGYNDGTFECHCGSENCRKTYQGNFFKLPRDLQIKYLPYLEEWFKNEHRQEIESLVGLEGI
jgi:SET domain-containing protein